MENDENIINIKLDYLKRILTDTLNDSLYLDFFNNGYPSESTMSEAMATLPIDKDSMYGLKWPIRAHTMIGIKRLNNLHNMLDYIRKNNIEGDLIETGVWRGGATIFMKCYLDFYQINKKVFVCDSFEGLPPPDIEKYPQDTGDNHHTFEKLKISLDTVKSNFQSYGVLDDNVIFIKGWFSDTLPNNNQIKNLAILRFDGDMYGSTIDVFNNLYDKVVSGGIIIIDDYCLPNCKKAVSDFRKDRNINNPLIKIDNEAIYSAVYWKK